MATAVEHGPTVQVRMTLSHGFGNKQEFFWEHTEAGWRLDDRDTVVGQLRWLGKLLCVKADGRCKRRIKPVERRERA